MDREGTRHAATSRFGTRRRRLLGLSLAVALTAGAAACGSDDDADVRTDDTPATTPATVAPATTAGSSDSVVPETSVETSAAPASTPGTPAPTSAPPATSPTNGLDREATLRWGATSTPTTLDPFLESNSGKRVWLWQIYDRLFLLDADRVLQPSIATSHEFADDGLTLTLTLRDDVQFHDGTPVDAAAVKYSIERAQTLEGSVVAPDLAVIEAVNIVDDTTVELQLSEQAPYLVTVLATSAGAVINPATGTASLADGDGGGTAGSGPYVVEQFEPNNGLTLQRAGGEYWDANAGNFASIEVKPYPDPQAALNALQTGEIDATVARGELAQLEQIATTSDLNLYDVQTAAQLGLFLRNSVEPLDEPLVRQALAHGINRQALAEDLLGDTCVYNPQGFLPGSSTYLEGQDVYPYDPERAQELLDEAGYGDGFDLPVMVVTGYAPAEDGVLLVQEDLAALGINVEVTPIAETDQIDLWRAGDRAAMFTAASGQPDDVLLIQRLWFGVYTLGETAGEAIQSAIDAALAPGLSEADRTAAYQAMGTAALSEATLIPVCNLIGRLIGTQDVVGLDRMSLNFLADAAGDPRYLGKAAG